MNSIPVLGVAIVNGVYWLTKQVASIDYPVDNYIVINNNGKGEIDDDLKALSKIKHPYIKNFKIVNLPSNLGCGGAWNLIIKSYITSPGWLITSHDVSFTPGFLEELSIKSNNEDIGLIFGHGGDFGLGSFDLFYIKDWAVNNIGLFDENLYPAYCEDWDYMIRLKQNPIKTIYNLEHKYYHGETFDYNISGKQTLKHDKHLSKLIIDAWEQNKEYMRLKWGDGWETFNISDSRINKPFDLTFRRKKYLGF
ncbi:hypothetical protein OAO15_00110 [bacterium]|jgi:GT2 family glycosyltransferase|nr:hypothetical protein [bacterium]